MNSLRSILTLLFSTLEKLISMHSSLLCISELEVVSGLMFYSSFENQFDIYSLFCSLLKDYSIVYSK